MPCNVKDDGSEIERCGREILFTKVLDSPGLFDLTSDGRTVIGGYIEFFYNKAVLTNCEVRKEVGLIVKVISQKDPRFQGRGSPVILFNGLCGFGKVIFLNLVHSDLFLFEIKPFYFNKIVFDVLQNFYNFSVNLTANMFAFFKQSPHSNY